MPFSSPSLAAFMAALIASYVVAFSVLNVRSTTETSGTGTQTAMPVSLPLSAGSARPTALAAPVLDGMMFWYAPRPPRQSFLLGPSTVGWVAVAAWMVLMRPSTRPNLSLITFATGARQLVVQEALLTTSCLPASYLSWFTPITSVGTSSSLALVGAEMTTRLAPALMCFFAPSKSVNRPV